MNLLERLYGYAVCFGSIVLFVVALGSAALVIQDTPATPPPKNDADDWESVVKVGENGEIELTAQTIKKLTPEDGAKVVQMSLADIRNMILDVVKDETKSQRAALRTAIREAALHRHIEFKITRLLIHAAVMLTSVLLFAFHWSWLQRLSRPPAANAS